MLSTLFELPRRTRPAHDHQVRQSAEQPTSSRTLPSVTPWRGEGTVTRTPSAEVLFSFSLPFFLFSKKLRGEGGGEDSKTLNPKLGKLFSISKFVMLTWNFYSSIAKVWNVFKLFRQTQKAWRHNWLTYALLNLPVEQWEHAYYLNYSIIEIVSETGL